MDHDSFHPKATMSLRDMGHGDRTMTDIQNARNIRITRRELEAWKRRTRLNLVERGITSARR